MHHPLTILVLINTALLLIVLFRLFHDSRQQRPVAPTDPAAIDELRDELRAVLEQLTAIQDSISVEAARLRGLAGDSAVHTSDIARLNVAILKTLRDERDPNGDKARITKHPEIRRVQ